MILITATAVAKDCITRLVSFKLIEIGARHMTTANRRRQVRHREADVIKAYQAAKDAGVQHFGIHVHIGSGILNPDPFLAALEKFINSQEGP